VADLLAAAGYGAEFTLHSLQGGGNNRVFRVETTGTSLLLKAYFRHPQDPRDRLGTEFAFSTFAWQHGVCALPQPLACDAERGLGLYEFVVGRRLLPHEVDKWSVQQALDFFAALNRVKYVPEAQALPTGSEACFTLAEHFECVERRLGRLQALDDHSELGRTLRNFVDQELAPAWYAIRAAGAAAAAALGLAEDDRLDAAERCLSPSDFGFHNALWEPTGRLRFLDFEYAGWDDPAKTICDFFCQPAVPVPETCLARVLEAVTDPMVRPEWQQQRIRLLLPVYRLKWCCILLNDFLPSGGQRRSFARGAVIAEEQKTRQLQKARQALHQLSRLTSPPFAA
jgi:hypothetical protein